MAIKKYIKNVAWIKQKEHKDINKEIYYITTFEITYYNGIKENVEMVEPIDSGLKLLNEVDFDDLILESLDRFASDGCENSEEWDRLYDKINNNKPLLEEDIEDIDICMKVCTIFESFSYKNYIKFKESINEII